MAPLAEFIRQRTRSYPIHAVSKQIQEWTERSDSIRSGKERPLPEPGLNSCRTGRCNSRNFPTIRAFKATKYPASRIGRPQKAALHQSHGNLRIHVRPVLEKVHAPSAHQPSAPTRLCTLLGSCIRSSYRVAGRTWLERKYSITQVYENHAAGRKHHYRLVCRRTLRYRPCHRIWALNHPFRFLWKYNSVCRQKRKRRDTYQLDDQPGISGLRTGTA